MSATDTIFALSTGAGVAGIAIIRVSGPAAGPLVDAIAGRRPPPRLVDRRLLKDTRSGEVIDQAIVIWMPAPRSVTGEDVAEFHVHGSAAVIDELFNLLRRFPAVRMAEAGEFTRRAFANGRMDLVEVEGLGDLLRARTAAQRRQAIHHLLGNASSVVESWRSALVGILAHIEAAIDFAEEEGVVAAALSDVRAKTTSLVDEMKVALASAGRAKAIRDGVKVVLAGRPNTGKSSLLNAIARRDAAIVSALPGTTRDVIEVQVDLRGVPVILTDTAGLRQSADDEIEMLGIEKSRQELRNAGVVVWVSAPDVEGSVPPDCDVAPDLTVLAKSDLVQHANALDGDGSFFVSALTGEGLPEFLEALGGLVAARFAHGDSAVVVRRRQEEAVEDSIRFLNDSLGHDDSSIELVAEDLRKAAHALARMTGRIDVEELLGAIFSEFCIGK